MVMREGKGRVAPVGVVVRLTPGEVRSAADLAIKRERFQRYGESGDAWRRGLIRNPTFFGLLGEFAFARWCNTHAGCAITVDTENRRSGDGGRDFVVEGLRFDIKSRATSSRNLVRRDRHQRFDCEAYVFGVVGPGAEVRARDVTLLGWVRHKDLRAVARLEESGRGHVNYRVLDRDLEPMAHLAERIKLGREWRAA